VERDADRLPHMLNPLGDLYRCETHDSKASRRQPSRARGVAWRRTIEHLAPDLDYQAR